MAKKKDTAMAIVRDLAATVLAPKLDGSDYKWQEVPQTLIRRAKALLKQAKKGVHK